MLFDLNRFLIAVSTALDYVEMGVLGASYNHTRRVAYVSLMMGRRLGLTDEERFDLVSLAILHDNGLCEEVLFSKIEFGKMDRLQRMEGFKEHCVIGEDSVRQYPFLTHPQNIVKYHHENWDGSGFFGLIEDEIPQPAQIVALADYVDNRFHFEEPELSHRREINAFIVENRDKRFSSDMVSCYLDVSGHTSCWLDLQSPQLERVLPENTPVFRNDIPLPDILELTRVFSRIIDAKSKFTARHSTGLIEKAMRMTQYYGFNDERSYLFAIAASLHDIGKLAIPNSIIEQRSSLTEDQFEVMKAHTYYTRAILRQIEGFEYITEWASNHHEKLNGMGYPYGFAAERLGFEDRLMTCLDIYQALTEKRPYREAASHEAVMEVLNRLAQNGYIDADIVADLDEVFSRSVI